MGTLYKYKCLLFGTWCLVLAALHRLHGQLVGRFAMHSMLVNFLPTHDWRCYHERIISQRRIRFIPV